MTRPQLKDLNFLAWLAWAAIFAIATLQAVRTPRPVDFTYFYSVGHILNNYGPDRLYDLDLQRDTFNSVWPLKAADGAYGASPYPPMVAALFQPFALLSFRPALVLWMSISLALYLAANLLLVRRFLPGEPLRQSILCCFAMLYWPFIVRTFLNGQLAAIGFFGIASAICLEDAGYSFLSGAALAICIYKPTLLILILPMLVITGRTRALLGLIFGSSVILALTTLLEGLAVWPAFLRTAAQFAALRYFVPWDEVDIVTVCAMLGHRSLIALGLIPAAFLLRLWLRNAAPALLWGTTVTWTLILNTYVPLYDSILVIAGIILTVRPLRAFSPRATMIVIVGILLSSYVTREIAAATGVQLLTLFLVALGVLQLRLCLKTGAFVGQPFSLPAVDPGSTSNKNRQLFCGAGHSWALHARSFTALRPSLPRGRKLLAQLHAVNNRPAWAPAETPSR